MRRVPVTGRARGLVRIRLRLAGDGTRSDHARAKAAARAIHEARRCLLSAKQPLLQTVLEHGADNIL